MSPEADVSLEGTLGGNQAHDRFSDLWAVDFEGCKPAIDGSKQLVHNTKHGILYQSIKGRHGLGGDRPWAFYPPNSTLRD